MPRGLPVGKPAVNSVITAPGVIRPTPPRLSSVNQRLPSGPFAIPQRPTPGVSPVLNSDTTEPSSSFASAVAAPNSAATSARASEMRARTLAVSAAPSGT
jgi:hypothetical protein